MPTAQNIRAIPAPLFGFLPAVCLILLAAKVFVGYAIPWWLVFLPVYILPAIAIAIILIIAFIGAVLFTLGAVFKGFKAMGMD